MTQIECKNVSMSYGGKTVLEHIDFTVNEGDYLLVIGENGTGKSTLIEGLLGLKAVSEGEREFDKIAIVGGKELDFADYCAPCGVCRQVMSEFCDESFTVILGKGNGEYKAMSLGELLPYGFKL